MRGQVCVFCKHHFTQYAVNCIQITPDSLLLYGNEANHYKTALGHHGTALPTSAQTNSPRPLPCAERRAKLPKCTMHQQPACKLTPSREPLAPLTHNAPKRRDVIIHGAMGYLDSSRLPSQSSPPIQTHRSGVGWTTFDRRPPGGGRSRVMRAMMGLMTS